VNIGVGAGKFLGVRRNFAQISTHLPKKNPKKITSKKMTAIHWAQGTSITISCPNLTQACPNFS